MELNFRQYSTQGHPLLILHGLFGSLGNWNWQSNQLKEEFAVYALDLRNHGASPHADTMNYPLMAQDVLTFMDSQNIASAYLLGHSMGGKVAMQLALDHPQRIDKLVVADIAPVEYEGDHEQIFEALQSVDMEQMNSRTEVDVALAQLIDDEQVRQFLLTNLLRKPEGGLYWRINLPALAASYQQLREKPFGNNVYNKDTLFIKGALSNYITEEHRSEILKRFPQAQIKVIMQAGHWLHAEKPQSFFHLGSAFLNGRE